MSPSKTDSRSKWKLFGLRLGGAGSLAGKVTIAFGLMILLIVGMAAVVYMHARSLEMSQRDLLQVRQPTTIAAKDVREGINRSLAALHGYLIAGMDEYKLDRSSAWEAIDQGVAALDSFGTTWDDKSQAELQDLRTALSSLQQAQQSAEDMFGTADNMPTVKLLLTEIREFAGTCTLLLASVLEHQQSLTEKGLTELRAGTQSLIMMVLAAAVAGILLGSIVVWRVTKSVTAPLKQLIRFAKSSAAGDLTAECRIAAKAEIGELFAAMKEMRDNVADIVSEATLQSTNVTTAAGEMSGSMQNASRSTGELSENAKSVAVSVEEMTSTVGEIAKNAENSATVAARASDLARVSNERIDELGVAANEIGRVIEVIQAIAEQTILLALNATIEAARAGDVGKGFAVVATEVKELAKQTATATDDIRNRIEGIQATTGEAITAIKEIGGVIDTVNQLSQSIASSVEEQSITAKDIARNVSDSATSLEVVAKVVNESSAASRDITESIHRVDAVLKRTTTVNSPVDPSTSSTEGQPA